MKHALPLLVFLGAAFLGSQPVGSQVFGADPDVAAAFGRDETLPRKPKKAAPEPRHPEKLRPVDEKDASAAIRRGIALTLLALAEAHARRPAGWDGANAATGSGTGAK